MASLGQSLSPINLASPLTAATSALGLGADLVRNQINPAVLPDGPPPVDEDGRIIEINAQAARDRRGLELDQEQSAAERAAALRTSQGDTRAAAAARGVSGGGSAQALQRGLLDRSQQDGAFAQRRTALGLENVEGRRRQNLLGVFEDRRRAQLGLDQQLQQRRSGFLDFLPF